MDDLLKETPTNFDSVMPSIFNGSKTKPVYINSFEDLLSMFGATNFIKKENTFEYHGQKFKMNVQEMLKNENLIRVRTGRSNSIGSKERPVSGAVNNERKPL